jgi:hypothetical protein
MWLGALKSNRNGSIAAGEKKWLLPALLLQFPAQGHQKAFCRTFVATGNGWQWICLCLLQSGPEAACANWPLYQ